LIIVQILAQLSIDRHIRIMGSIPTFSRSLPCKPRPLLAPLTVGPLTLPTAS
jgi:hypothetical protein